MAGLAETLRQRAKETALAATSMLDAEDFETSAKKQSLFIIGQVNANTFATMADVLEQIELTARTQTAEAIIERRASVLKRNDAIRRAAASGDWNEYDRLAAGGELAGVGSSSVATGTDGQA